MSLSFPLNMDEFWNREKQFFGELLLKRLVVLLFTLSFIQPSVASVPDSESYYGDTDYVFDIPIVLTPTRLEQPVSQIPGSVTTITQDQIQKYGINRISEALRLVPGMVVDRLNYSWPWITYHGPIGYIPNRMKVLLDNVEVYMGGLAGVDWEALPVDIEDVDRIEVVRGATSASYGDNAFLAVINIITQTAATRPGWQISTLAGSLETYKTRIKYEDQFSETTSIRATGSRESNHGYDQQSYGQAGSSSTSRISLRFDNLQDSAEYRFFLNYSKREPDDGRREIEEQNSLISALMLDAPLRNDHFLKAKVTYRITERIKEWSDCLHPILFSDELQTLYELNPNIVHSIAANDLQIPTNLTLNTTEALVLGALFLRNQSFPSDSMCGTLNENFTDQDLSLNIQDTWSYSPRLRIASGLAFRISKVESETYLGRSITENQVGIFSNAEYILTEYSWLNLGGYFETQGEGEQLFSPRIGYIYQFSDNNFVKLVRSYASRSPDTAESHANYRYWISDIDPAFFGTDKKGAFIIQKSPSNLKAEEIVSTELIFYGYYSNSRVNWDLKFFHEDMKNLLAERVNYLDFNPSNNTYIKLKGIELALNYSFSHSVQWHWNHTIIDAETNSFTDSTIIPNTVGLISVDKSWNSQYYSSLIYYYTERDKDLRDYHRTDLVVGYTSKSGLENRIRSSLTLSYFDTTGYFLESGKEEALDGTVTLRPTFSESFDSRWHAYLQLSIDL